MEINFLRFSLDFFPPDRFFSLMLKNFKKNSLIEVRWHGRGGLGGFNHLKDPKRSHVIESLQKETDAKWA